VISAVQDTIVSLSRLRKKVALTESAVGSDVMRDYHSLLSPVLLLIRSGSTSPPNDPLDFDLHIRMVIEQLQEWLKGSPETTVAEIMTLLHQADLAALPNVRLITTGVVSGSALISSAASNLRTDLSALEAVYPNVAHRSQFAAEETAKVDLIDKIRAEIKSTIREGINISTTRVPVSPVDVVFNGTLLDLYHLSMYRGVFDGQLVVRDPGNGIANITAWPAPYDTAGLYYSRNYAVTWGATSLARGTGAAAVLAPGTSIMSLTNQRNLPLVLKYKLRFSQGVRDAGAPIVVTTHEANAAFNPAVTYEWYGTTLGTQSVRVPPTYQPDDNYAFGSLVFAANETIVLRSPSGYANASTAFGCSFEVIGGYLDATSLFGTATDFSSACNAALTPAMRARFCDAIKWDKSTEMIMKKLEQFSDYIAASGVAGHMAEGIFPSTSTAAIDNRVSDGVGGYITLAHNNDIFDPCFWLTLKGTYPYMGSVEALVQRFLARMQVVAQIMGAHQGFLETLHH
jgi:hypothetical protein